MHEKLERGLITIEVWLRKRKYIYKGEMKQTKISET